MWRLNLSYGDLCLEDLDQNKRVSMPKNFLLGPHSASVRNYMKGFNAALFTVKLSSFFVMYDDFFLYLSCNIYIYIYKEHSNEKQYYSAYDCIQGFCLVLHVDNDLNLQMKCQEFTPLEG